LFYMLLILSVSTNKIYIFITYGVCSGCSPGGDAVVSMLAISLRELFIVACTFA